MTADVRFLKGHGTENDFVVLPDPLGRLEVGAGLVRSLCDRRTGLGADGVLRVVRTVEMGSVYPEGPGPVPEWFMDYRNADGSVAEMCGNGVRVFARFLLEEGLQGGSAAGSVTTFQVGTRAGARTVTVESDGLLTVGMGMSDGPRDRVEIEASGERHDGVFVSMGNPHVVTFVDALAEAGELREAPVLRPALPDGANVEFVVREAPGHLAMRVFERGVGETRSCGTGACAVAVAAAALDGQAERWTYGVDVPGGRLAVTRAPSGEIMLTGPAVIVAEGALRADWVAERA